MYLNPVCRLQRVLKRARPKHSNTQEVQKSGVLRKSKERGNHLKSLAHTIRSSTHDLSLSLILQHTQRFHPKDDACCLLVPLVVIATHQRSRVLEKGNALLDVEFGVGQGAHGVEGISPSLSPPNVNTAGR